MAREDRGSKRREQMMREIERERERERERDTHTHTHTQRYRDMARKYS